MEVMELNIAEVKVMLQDGLMVTRHDDPLYQINICAPGTDGFIFEAYEPVSDGLLVAIIQDWVRIGPIIKEVLGDTVVSIDRNVYWGK